MRLHVLIRVPCRKRSLMIHTKLPTYRGLGRVKRTECGCPGAQELVTEGSCWYSGVEGAEEGSNSVFRPNECWNYAGGVSGAFVLLVSQARKEQGRNTTSPPLSDFLQLLSWAIPNQKPAEKEVWKGDAGPKGLSPRSSRIDEGRELDLGSKWRVISTPCI